jgi:hypothetical protein
MTGPVWHRAAAAAAVLVLGAVTACSAPQPELADTAAAKLQSRAAAIRTAAADGNYQTALRALDGLTDELTRAAGQGDVSFPRYQSIDIALGRLRADLTAASKAASPSPPPSSTRTAPAAATVPVEQSPPSSAAPVQPAVPAPAEPKSQRKAGKASGKGKAANPGNGKGKGNSKAKDK